MFCIIHKSHVILECSQYSQTRPVAQKQKKNKQVRHSEHTTAEPGGLAPLAGYMNYDRLILWISTQCVLWQKKINKITKKHFFSSY